MAREGHVPLPLETGPQVGVRVNVPLECWSMAEQWVAVVEDPGRVNCVPLCAGSQTPAVHSAAIKHHGRTKHYKGCIK